VVYKSLLELKSYSQIINDIDTDIWYDDDFYAGSATAQ
jgi:hypothetical protein